MEVKLPSGKELVVFELLINRREMYGLEMVKASKELRRGTIYVLLNRMEDKGYVKSRSVKVEGSAGLPLRAYSLTGYGQQIYRAWQNSVELLGSLT